MSIQYKIQKEMAIKWNKMAVKQNSQIILLSDRDVQVYLQIAIAIKSLQLILDSVNLILLTIVNLIA